MIPLQEVSFYSDKKSKSTAHLIFNESENVFYVESFIFDPNIHPNNSIHVKENKDFSNIEDAFSVALNKTLGYFNRSGQRLIKIDNPCYCEYIKQEQQQDIVNKLGLGLIVK